LARAGLQMCCNVGGVSFFFFCGGGRKKQNKFPQIWRNTLNPQATYKISCKGKL